jgi:hypothetical protein
VVPVVAALASNRFRYLVQGGEGVNLTAVRAVLTGFSAWRQTVRRCVVASLCLLKMPRCCGHMRDRG